MRRLEEAASTTVGKKNLTMDKLKTRRRKVGVLLSLCPSWKPRVSAIAGGSALLRPRAGKVGFVADASTAGSANLVEPSIVMFDFDALRR